MSQAKTSPTDLIVSLQSVLYKPCRRYFETILFGSLLTVGCISSWILAGSQDKRYKKVYWFIARIGKQVDFACSFKYRRLTAVQIDGALLRIEASFQLNVCAACETSVPPKNITS